MASTSQHHSPERPWAVWLIGAIVWVEALVLAFTGVSFFMSLFSEHIIPAAGIIFASVVLIGIAVWLAAAARGTFKGRRWPRAAILVTQVFLVVVGISLSQSGATAIGVLGVVAAGVTLIALFNRSTVAWMTESTRYPSR